MAKISANYEVVFIMDGRLPEEQVAALTEKFKTLVEQNSTAMEVEEWGKRKLAYAINYITEGYYVLISFTSAPDFPKELDRILGITDGIIRSMIVCMYSSSVKHFFNFSLDSPGTIWYVESTKHSVGYITHHQFFPS